MKKLILFFLTFIITGLVFSQSNSIVDSLWRNYKNASHDSVRIEILIADLGYTFEGINPDSALILYNKAIELADKNIESARKSSDKKSELFFLEKKAVALRYSGIVYRTLSDYETALFNYKRSINIYKELILESSAGKREEYNVNISGTYNNIGSIYRNQGVNDKATLYLLKAIANFEITVDSENQSVAKMSGYALAGAYNNVALIYNNQGIYEKAIKYFEKSLEIRKKMSDVYGIAQSLSNMAISTFRMAVLVTTPELKTARLNESLQMYFTALSCYDSLLSDQANIKNFRLLKLSKADCFGNIGLLYKTKGDGDNALKYFNEAIKIREELGDKVGICGEKSNLASLYISIHDRLNLNESNLIRGYKYAEEALKLSEEIGLKAEMKSAVRNMAMILQGLGNFEKAREYYFSLSSMNFSDILTNFSFITEKEKELFFSMVSSDFNFFYNFALRNLGYKPDIAGDVFDNVIRSKGLLLKSSTAMRAAILNSGDEVLKKDYYDWTAIKKSIIQNYTLEPEKRDKNLDKLIEKADSIEKVLAKKSFEFSDFNNIQKISWTDVKKSLKPGEAAIEFVHFKYDPVKIVDLEEVKYCALVLTSDSEYPVMIPLCNQKQLQDILGIDAENDINYINNIYGKKNNTSRQLYKLIWKPIESKLTGIKRVYVSPSGLLHKISLAAIADENGIFLSDKLDLRIKSNTGNIALESTVSDVLFSDAEITAAVFGGIDYNLKDSVRKIVEWEYLDGTKRESENITNLLTGQKINVKYFSDKSATEEQFKIMAANSDLLHIATHGFFFPSPEQLRLESDTANKITEEKGDVVFRGGARGFGVAGFVENDNPLMRSGLVFAGANEVWNATESGENEDGVLTAQEVINIDMRKTSMVVLSACETGLGEIVDCEGVYGLQRAFKMAGVKYIVMSLWQVPDKETVEFMTLFYSRLLKLKDIQQAFSETQKEMRKKYDPYFWGAFVLVE
ncbi:MAG: hypothetical protein A2W91_04230 [Bacteroidetes bacterium GWF2_38_335]|nr:MAG: hypothetical protein A2W91_04230 [Bacteroidetes bacterium GWF2_38_335]HBS88755.1 hypothetical protein [Bacteroidales bacterium]